jgi:hypothetical protein
MRRAILGLQGWQLKSRELCGINSFAKPYMVEAAAKTATTATMMVATHKRTRFGSVIQGAVER